MLILLNVNIRKRFIWIDVWKYLLYDNYISNVANWYFQDGMHQSRDILSRQFFMLRWIFLFFPYSMLFFLFAYRSGLSQIYMVKTCRRSSSIVLLQTVSPCLYINENHIEYFLCGSNHGLYSKFFLIWYAKTVWVHDYSIENGVYLSPLSIIEDFQHVKGFINVFCRNIK